jgi:hypothetical protein
MSIGTSENEKSENNSFYHYTNYGKASLKICEYLEPTQEFIKVVVKDTIKSQNSNVPKPVPSDSLKVKDKYFSELTIKIFQRSDFQLNLNKTNCSF